MALIAVVCVAGVVSAEMLGPMAKLRSFHFDDDDADSDKRFAMGGNLAGDVFGADQPLLLEFLAPKLSPSVRGLSHQRYLPQPAFSAVAMLFDGDGGDEGSEIILTGYQAPADGLSQPDALVEAQFTPSTEPTPFFFSVSPVIPYSFGAPPPAGGSGPPPPSAPEPASWLLMILGLGGVGLALRRRRGEAGRSPRRWSAPTPSELGPG